MKKKMPKNAKKLAYKEKEFKAYVMWKSIPLYLYNATKKMLDMYGFDNDLAYEVSDIKNQTEFAKRFGIKDLGTLTDWNNKIEEKDLHNLTYKRVIARQAGEAYFVLTMRAIKYGRAREVLAFHKIINSDDPKSSKQKIPMGEQMQNTIEAQQKVIAVLSKQVRTYERQLGIHLEKTKAFLKKVRERDVERLKKLQ